MCLGWATLRLWRVKMQAGQDKRFAMVPTKLKQVIIRNALRADENHMLHFKDTMTNTARIDVDWDGVTCWKSDRPNRNRFGRIVEPEDWIEDGDE